MGTLAPAQHQPLVGDKTKISVAIGAIVPTAQTVTLANATPGTAFPAGSAAALTVTALTAPIDAGNWLLFKDDNDIEYLAKVTADAATGATTITANLERSIPDAATAAFPPELFDRSAADLDRTYNTQSTVTLNTGGENVYVPGAKEKSISSPGFWNHFNAGYKVCEDRAEAKGTVWVLLEYPAPSTAFSKGEVFTAQCVITSMPKASPADNFIQGDVEFQVTGTTTLTPPVVV